LPARQPRPGAAARLAGRCLADVRLLRDRCLAARGRCRSRRV